MTPWTTIPAWAALKSRELFGVPDRPLLSMSAAHGLRLRDLSEGRAPSEDLSDYRGVEVGDVVINKLSARDGAISTSMHSGIVSPAYWVLKPDYDVVVPRSFVRSHCDFHQGTSNQR